MRIINRTFYGLLLAGLIAARVSFACDIGSTVTQSISISSSAIAGTMLLLKKCVDSYNHPADRSRLILPSLLQPEQEPTARGLELIRQTFDYQAADVTRALSRQLTLELGERHYVFTPENVGNAQSMSALTAASHQSLANYLIVPQSPQMPVFNPGALSQGTGLLNIKPAATNTPVRISIPIDEQVQSPLTFQVKESSLSMSALHAEVREQNLQNAIEHIAMAGNVVTRMRMAAHDLKVQDTVVNALHISNGPGVIKSQIALNQEIANPGSPLQHVWTDVWGRLAKVTHNADGSFKGLVTAEEVKTATEAVHPYLVAVEKVYASASTKINQNIAANQTVSAPVQRSAMGHCLQGMKWVANLPVRGFKAFFDITERVHPPKITPHAAEFNADLKRVIALVDKNQFGTIPSIIKKYALGSDVFDQQHAQLLTKYYEQSYRAHFEQDKSTVIKLCEQGRFGDAKNIIATYEQLSDDQSKQFAQSLNTTYNERYYQVFNIHKMELKYEGDPYWIEIAKKDLDVARNTPHYALLRYTVEQTLKIRYEEMAQQLKVFDADLSTASATLKEFTYYLISLPRKDWTMGIEHLMKIKPHFQEVLPNIYQPNGLFKGFHVEHAEIAQYPMPSNIMSVHNAPFRTLYGAFAQLKCSPEQLEQVISKGLEAVKYGCQATTPEARNAFMSYAIDVHHALTTPGADARIFTYDLSVEALHSPAMHQTYEKVMIGVSKASHRLQELENVISPEAIKQQIASVHQLDVAQDAIRALRAGDVQKAERMLKPELTLSPEAIKKIASYLQNNNPDKPVSNAQVMAIIGGIWTAPRMSSITHEQSQEITHEQEQEGDQQQKKGARKISGVLDAKQAQSTIAAACTIERINVDPTKKMGCGTSSINKTPDFPKGQCLPEFKPKAGMCGTGTVNDKEVDIKKLSETLSTDTEMMKRMERHKQERLWKCRWSRGLSPIEATRTKPAQEPAQKGETATDSGESSAVVPKAEGAQENAEVAEDDQLTEQQKAVQEKLKQLAENPDAVQRIQGLLEISKEVTGDAIAAQDITEILIQEFNGNKEGLIEQCGEGYVEHITQILEEFQEGNANEINKPLDYGHSSIQYEQLKAALAREEITSVIKCTEHGLQRLIERGFKADEILSLISNPDWIRIQNDGAKAFIQKIGEKYRIIVLNEQTGEVVTALKGTTEHKIVSLGKNYGWKL